MTGFPYRDGPHGPSRFFVRHDLPRVEKTQKNNENVSLIAPLILRGGYITMNL